MSVSYEIPTTREPYLLVIGDDFREDFDFADTELQETPDDISDVTRADFVIVARNGGRRVVWSSATGEVTLEADHLSLAVLGNPGARTTGVLAASDAGIWDGQLTLTRAGGTVVEVAMLFPLVAKAAL